MSFKTERELGFIDINLHLNDGIRLKEKRRELLGLPEIFDALLHFSEFEQALEFIYQEILKDFPE